MSRPPNPSQLIDAPLSEHVSPMMNAFPSVLDVPFYVSQACMYIPGGTLHIDICSNCSIIIVSARDSKISPFPPQILRDKWLSLQSFV